MRKCRSLSMPFALALLPDSREPLFFASDRPTDLRSGFDPRHEGFVVSTFGVGDNRATYGIAADLTVNDILSLPADDTSIAPAVENLDIRSTSYDDYSLLIRSVVDSFKGNSSSKVVISRVILEESAKSPHEVAEAYFNRFPSCFRAIYYTPATGMWIVATPEVLLDCNLADGHIATMSLAGTRPIGSAEWDQKNLREHQIVTDYIAEMMRRCGLSPKVGPLTELPFGAIKHLCNRIEAEHCTDPIALAYELNPTPAVCGFPREEALTAIVEGEKHPRDCYSGFIGINHGESCRLYVNLRCCRAWPAAENIYRYLLYAGGGINWLSNVDDEWRETELKITPLQEAITK